MTTFQALFSVPLFRFNISQGWMRGEQSVSQLRSWLSVSKNLYLGCVINLGPNICSRFRGRDLRFPRNYTLVVSSSHPRSTFSRVYLHFAVLWKDASSYYNKNFQNFSASFSLFMLYKGHDVTVFSLFLLPTKIYWIYPKISYLPL